MKIRIEPLIIVEGKYDKIKLENIVDGIIIATDGFSVFKDKEAQKTLFKLAKAKGAIIMTDSDRAGFLIRKYLHDILRDTEIYDIYIPDIFGKEKRKDMPSAEGKLGVEGVPQSILAELLSSYNSPKSKGENNISVTDLYAAGLYGGDNSSEKRRCFQHFLALPARLNKNMLLKVLNSMFTREQFLQQLNLFEKHKETL